MYARGLLVGLSLFIILPSISRSFALSEQVRAYAIKLPDVRMICVVKICTAGGLYGVGESGLSFRELAVKGVRGAALSRPPLPVLRRVATDWCA